MPKPVEAASKSKSGIQPRNTRLDREAAEARLVTAAIALLADKGPTELRVRSVADAAGMSTIAVYHHLGGLPELVNAVVERGFQDLGDAFRETPATNDPVTDLFAMALASRRFAQANPHLYDLMFGLSTRGGYRPADSASKVRADSFQVAYALLMAACDRLVSSGRVRADQDPEAVAPQLWSAVHGFITLELGNHFAHFRDPVREVLQPTMVNIAIGLGDDPKLALASHTAAMRASR
jgi:AcrR family transcriptional regulator